MVPALFLLLNAAIATAHAGIPAASCAPEAPSAEDFAAAAHQSACRGFEKYHSVSVPTDPSAPLDCAAYGVVPGRPVTTFDEALALDCDVLEYYVPSSDDGAERAPIAELALACRAIHARQVLSDDLAAMVPGLRGSRETRAQARSLRSQRAAVCAIQAFGRAYAKPEDPRFDPTSGGSPLWGDREADLARIEAAALSDSRKEELRRQVSSGEWSVEGRRNPIDADGFIRMINTVIAEEHATRGTTPTLGNPVEWSSEFQDCVGDRMVWPHLLGRQLMVLAVGAGDHYTPTGRESELHNWILSQPDFSIEPAALFREAYRASKGDVSAAIRTIENVLSLHWLTPNRETLLQTRKLKPITNTLGAGEDVFGSWYHLFGIMLYGLSSRDSAHAVAVAGLETAGSHVLSGFEPEPQENRINGTGARIGNRLRRSLERGDWKSLEQVDASALEFENYTNLDETFKKPLQRR